MTCLYETVCEWLFSLSFAQSEVYKKLFSEFEEKNLNSIHNVLQTNTFGMD